MDRLRGALSQVASLAADVASDFGEAATNKGVLATVMDAGRHAGAAAIETGSGIKAKAAEKIKSRSPTVTTKEPGDSTASCPETNKVVEENQAMEASPTFVEDCLAAGRTSDSHLVVLLSESFLASQQTGHARCLVKQGCGTSEVAVGKKKEAKGKKGLQSAREVGATLVKHVGECADIAAVEKLLSHWCKLLGLQEPVSDKAPTAPTFLDDLHPDGGSGASEESTVGFAQVLVASGAVKVLFHKVLSDKALRLALVEAAPSLADPAAPAEPSAAPDPPTSPLPSAILHNLFRLCGSNTGPVMVPLLQQLAVCLDASSESQKDPAKPQLLPKVGCVQDGDAAAPGAGEPSDDVQVLVEEFCAKAVSEMVGRELEHSSPGLPSSAAPDAPAAVQGAARSLEETLQLLERSLSQSALDKPPTQPGAEAQSRRAGGSSEVPTEHTDLEEIGLATEPSVGEDALPEGVAQLPLTQGEDVAMSAALVRMTGVILQASEADQRRAAALHSQAWDRLHQTHGDVSSMAARVQEEGEVQAESMRAAAAARRAASEEAVAAVPGMQGDVEQLEQRHGALVQRRRDLTAQMAALQAQLQAVEAEMKLVESEKGGLEGRAGLLEGSAGTAALEARALDQEALAATARHRQAEQALEAVRQLASEENRQRSEQAQALARSATSTASVALAVRHLACMRWVGKQRGEVELITSQLQFCASEMAPLMAKMAKMSELGLASTIGAEVLNQMPRIRSAYDEACTKLEAIEVEFEGMKKQSLDGGHMGDMQQNELANALDDMAKALAQSKQVVDHTTGLVHQVPATASQ